MISVVSLQVRATDKFARYYPKHLARGNSYYGICKRHEYFKKYQKLASE